MWLLLRHPLHRDRIGDENKQPKGQKYILKTSTARGLLKVMNKSSTYPKLLMFQLNFAKRIYAQNLTRKSAKNFQDFPAGAATKKAAARFRSKERLKS